MALKNDEVNLCHTFNSISKNNGMSIKQVPGSSMNNSITKTQGKSCVANIVSDVDVPSEQDRFFTLEDTGKELRKVSAIEYHSTDPYSCSDNHNLSPIMKEESIEELHYQDDQNKVQELIEVDPTTILRSSEIIMSDCREKDQLLQKGVFNHPTEKVKNVKYCTNNTHRDEDRSDSSRKVECTSCRKLKLPSETVQNFIPCGDKSETNEMNCFGEQKQMEVHPKINLRSSENDMSNCKEKEQLVHNRPIENAKNTTSDVNNIRRNEVIISDSSREVNYISSRKYNIPVKIVQNFNPHGIKSENNERNCFGVIQFEQDHKTKAPIDIVREFIACTVNKLTSEKEISDVKINMQLNSSSGELNIPSTLAHSTISCTIDIKYNSSNKEIMNISSNSSEDVQLACKYEIHPKEEVQEDVNSMMRQDENEKSVTFKSEKAMEEITNNGPFQPTKTTDGSLYNDTNSRNRSTFREQLFPVGSDTESDTELSRSSEMSQVTQNTRSVQSCINNVNVVAKNKCCKISNEQVKPESDINIKKRTNSSKIPDNEDINSDSIKFPSTGRKNARTSFARGSTQESRKNRRASTEVTEISLKKQEKVKRKYRERLPRLFLCHICGVTKKRNNILQRHILNHEKAFRCKVCCRTFNDSITLALHYYKKHNRGPRPSCSICGFEYDRRYTYNQHLESHDESTRVVCDVCKKSFQNKITLRCHLRLHSDDRFECSQCSKHFYTKSALKVHIENHNNLPKFTCDKCNVQYSTKFNLLRHSMHC